MAKRAAKNEFCTLMSVREETHRFINRRELPWINLKTGLTCELKKATITKIKLEIITPLIYKQIQQ